MIMTIRPSCGRLAPQLTWAKALMYYRFLPTDLRLAGYTAAWQVVPGGSGDHVLDEPTACHVASCA